MAKKKTSVEDTVADFFKEKKRQYSSDLFDPSTSIGLVNISLSRIVEDKDQPRKTFNNETIKELASSIKEQGIINPITVRPYGEKYVVIAGERRFLAAKEAGLKTVPALTAVVATLALGKESVNGILMPSPYSSRGSIDDAIELSHNLGIKYITIPISDIYSSYLENLSAIFKHSEINVTKENIQARIRGNIIMAAANENSWLVLSTGNKSEISVGYCTLYGDMVGGFSPIKDVYKTMAYRICRYINKKYSNIIPKKIIIKVPSAELKPNQKDEDKLPPYKILDPILKAYIEDDLDYRSITKKGFDKKIVKEVINMVDYSEYKRRQGSPGIKITPRAFGKNRRYPITNNFKLY